MLQILRNPEIATATIRTVRPRPVLPHVHITVAKARHYPMHARSHFAASWLKGALTIKPTWDLAQYIFRVHPSQIQEARLNLIGTTFELAIDTVWAGTAPVEKVEFVKAHLPEIWNLVDQATA